MLNISASKPAYRGLLFLSLLLSEILTITHTIDLSRQQDFDLPVASRSVFALFFFIKDHWRLCCWVLAGCFISITPHLNPIFNEYTNQIQGYSWYKLLTLHTLFFAAFLILSRLIFTSGIRPDYLTTFWFVCWISVGVIAFILLLLALAPTSFWLTLTRRYFKNFLAGAILGILTNAIFDLFARQEAPLAQQELWAFLSSLTLQTTYSILKLVYDDNELIYEPDSMSIGTDVFPVEITYACSGIEGVSLITVFLAIYLFLFRKQLHFPAVFWLFPIGIIAIWFSNAIRIALLVVLGHFFSADVAGSAFHAQAGWIAFTFIALCMITLVHRMRIFSRVVQQKNSNSKLDVLAIALLAPWLTQIATLMITSALTNDFDLLYPIRICLICAVLFRYRRTYRSFALNWSWEAPFMGVIVFIIWIMLENAQPNETYLLNEEINKLPLISGIAWVFFRIVGSVIIIPLAEEFAFRGYLIRKLVSNDFENVAPQTFTLLSFIGSSLIFGLLHDRWFAGTLAGMGYAFVLYRHGRIGDAIVAHMTTNALIAISVLLFGKWSLWQ